MLLVLCIHAVSRPVGSFYTVTHFQFLSSISQVMSEDLIPEKMREDYQDGESLSSVCVQSFRERWWNKVLLAGVLETDGRQHKMQTDTKS